MEKEWVELGKALRSARANTGISQKRLAARLGNAIGHTAIVRCERGERTLPIEVLRDIARICKVSPWRLLNARSADKTRVAKMHMPPPKDTSESIRVNVAERALIDGYRRANKELRVAARHLLDGSLDRDTVDTMIRASKVKGMAAKTTSEILEEMFK